MIYKSKNASIKLKQESPINMIYRKDTLKRRSIPSKKIQLFFKLITSPFR